MRSTRTRPLSLPASGPAKRTERSEKSAFMNAARDSCASDQVVELVRQRVAPVGPPERSEPVADRTLQLELAVGAGDRGKTRDRDHRLLERGSVGVFERPCRVELMFRREAGCGRELAEQPRLRKVGIGW